MNPHKASPFALSILPRYFVALDIETTGLTPDRDEIVEIAALKFDMTSFNHNAYSVLLKTRRPIPESATEIHGITNEMCVAGGIEVRDAINNLYDFIGMHPVVCHNADFDVAFIREYYGRQSLKFMNEVSCTLKMSRRAFRGLPSYSLEFLARLGNPNKPLKFHRAMDDVIHTAKLYLACVETLKKLK